MLIPERMSDLPYNHINNLKSRYAAKVTDQYQPGTFTGKLCLIFYALFNFTTPSAFLAKKSAEALAFYVSNAGKIRQVLHECETSLKSGLKPTDAATCQLTDGTRFQLILDIDESDGQVRNFILKNETTGKCAVLGFMPAQLIEKIEQDILDNPDLFDARLVASCRLRPAFDNIEALQKAIYKKNSREARQAGQADPTEFDRGGCDDFLMLLTDPETAHGNAFIQHMEVIAENLLHTGFYEDQWHPDEVALRKFQMCALHSALADFISQNLNHLLLGKIRGNEQTITIAIRLLSLIPRQHSGEHNINKLNLLEQYFNGVALGWLPLEDYGTVLKKCLDNYRNAPSPLNRKNLMLAKKVIDQLPVAADPGDPLSADSIKIFNELREQLASTLETADRTALDQLYAVPPTVMPSSRKVG